jgi:hypothetical protein
MALLFFGNNWAAIWSKIALCQGANIFIVVVKEPVKLPFSLEFRSRNLERKVSPAAGSLSSAAFKRGAFLFDPLLCQVIVFTNSVRM